MPYQAAPEAYSQPHQPQYVPPMPQYGQQPQYGQPQQYGLPPQPQHGQSGAATLPSPQPMSPYGAGEPAVTPAIGNVRANPAFIDHLSPEYSTPVRIREQSESPTGIPDAEYLPMSTRVHIDAKKHLAGAQDGEYLLQLNQLSVNNNGQVHTKSLETGKLEPMIILGCSSRLPRRTTPSSGKLHVSLTSLFHFHANVNCVPSPCQHTRDIQQDGGSFWLAGSPCHFSDIQSLIEYYSSPDHLSDAATKHRVPDFPVKLATVKFGTV